MGNHYNSWKNYNLCEVLIIRYEDLINKTKDKFCDIVSYLNKLHKIEVDKAKILECIQLTKFVNLQSLEKKYGFEDKTLSKNFFRKGEIGSWKKELDIDLSTKIEKYFKKEMEELGYL